MSAAPLQLILMGAGGRMGQAILRLVASAPAPGFRVVAALDRPGSPLIGQDAGSTAGIAALGVPISPDLDAALSKGGMLPSTSANTAPALPPPPRWLPPASPGSSAPPGSTTSR